MSEGATLWSRETSRLYLKYMVVGLAAVPAGIVYGLLAMGGLERPWTVVLVLVLGLSTARWACRIVEKRWLSIHSEEFLIYPDTLAYQVSSQEIRVAPAPAATVAFFVILTFGSAGSGMSLQPSTHIKPMAGTKTVFYHNF